MDNGNTNNDPKPEQKPMHATARNRMLQDFATVEQLQANDPFLAGLRQHGECRLVVGDEEELIDEDEPTRVWVQRDGAIQPAEASWFKPSR